MTWNNSPFTLPLDNYGKLVPVKDWIDYWCMRGLVSYPSDGKGIVQIDAYTPEDLPRGTTHMLILV